MFFFLTVSSGQLVFWRLQVSFIDKWLLGLAPIKKLLLRVLQKPKRNENSVLQRQVVYSFGDHYHFRKETKILNLLTGYGKFPFHQECTIDSLNLSDFSVGHTCLCYRYILLLDKSGRIRWQGFGTATPEEVSQLLSCTSQLLEDQ